ncbi:MAG TPA: energy transducer TonB [Alphaproteobacteria bacterium]|nr:energy transducer TonB [Alphaproteobacteria bacterium]
MTRQTKLLLLANILLLPGLFSYALPAVPAQARAHRKQADRAPKLMLPFYLKASITERGAHQGSIEIHWINPFKWRRVIKTESFSQTLVVNGDKVFEDDSDEYFPVSLRLLASALMNPADEAGNRFVTFFGSQKFQGQTLPRRMGTNFSDGWGAQIIELKSLQHPDESFFVIASPTAEEKRIINVSLPEAELQSLDLGNREIIWPQVLDGETTGSVSIYVSIDSKGLVREVLPVRSDNERANESACRQIKTWKFKPVSRNGAPAQADIVMTFAMNTRAWGPASPLSDAEVRKLASNTVEPVIQKGTVPPGTSYTLRIAIDAEGRLIEVIPSKGPSRLFGPCYEAIKQWRFQPILENGEPRPYRGEVAFTAR